MPRERTGKQPNTIPRPMNSFMLYRKDNSSKYSNMRVGEKSKLISADWSVEPECVKVFYQQRAAEEKSKHKMLYPDYKLIRKQKPKKVISASQMRDISSNKDDEDYEDEEGEGEGVEDVEDRETEQQVSDDQSRDTIPSVELVAIQTLRTVEDMRIQQMHGMQYMQKMVQRIYMMTMSNQNDHVQSPTGHSNISQGQGAPIPWIRKDPEISSHTTSRQLGNPSMGAVTAQFPTQLNAYGQMGAANNVQSIIQPPPKDVNSTSIDPNMHIHQGLTTSLGTYQASQNQGTHTKSTSTISKSPHVPQQQMNNLDPYINYHAFEDGERSEQNFNIFGCLSPRISVMDSPSQ